jgi:RHS repeat-associated protein
MGLNSATDGSNSARFEYGPFGEPIRASGPRAADGRIRFSSKYTDQESGLVYYGYRFYNAVTGRWINRDPIEEDGGINLTGVNNGDCLNRTDYLGLVGVSPNPSQQSAGAAKSNIFPDLGFLFGQSVSGKYCWPTPWAGFICLSGGTQIKIGTCCDSKTSQKRRYAKFTADLKMSFEFGASQFLSFSIKKPIIEDIGACPREYSFNYELFAEARAGAFVAQAKYGGVWGKEPKLSYTGSISMLNLTNDKWTFSVAVGGGISGNMIKLQ